MLCNCYIIPKYIEDRVENKIHDGLLKTQEILDKDKNQDLISKSQEISTELRQYRKTGKHVKDLHKMPSGSTKNYIYSAKNRRNLPGLLVASTMNEASTSKDPDVILAWTFSDYFARFCREVLHRDPFDGAIKSTIHYFTRYNNAFFNGTQIIYGDGDDVTFEDFSQDPSVVFHELWHGITDATCGLIYQDQSGALNESLSDVFASIIMQWVNGETIDEASWLIGERCVIDKDNVSYALRSLIDPGTAFVNHPTMGTDAQRHNMDNYYGSTDNDNRSIHINSGIPNHAFYLFAKEVGGYSHDIPCSIWYKTISTPGLISLNCTFVEFAQATISTANELYGSTDPTIVEKLTAAWQAVKVL